MRVLMLVLGVLAAGAAGSLALFTAGDVPGAAVGVGLLVLVVGGLWLARAAMRALTLVFAVVLVGALGFGGWNAYELASAFTTTAGDSEPPDARALASAEAKIESVEQQAGFRLELTQDELEAMVQDALLDGNGPIHTVEVELLRDAEGEPGYLDFTARFKNGSLTATGEVSYELVAGEIHLKIRDVGVGRFSLPAAARGAIEDLVERVTDLNQTLAEERVTVQELSVGGGRLVLVGAKAGGEVLTSETLLSGLREQVSGLSVSAAAPPVERIPPGEVNGVEHPGDVVYVALGDSLAANVGVDQPREGYVSRFHAEVQRRDGRPYGLRNLGISGETSGSLLRGGQLDEAVAYMGGRDVAYVTLDIGANDLLPHLGSSDCAEAPAGVACATRIEASLATYRQTLSQVLERIREAAPQAQIVFLRTYNPFSFGLALDFERATDEAVTRLNEIAAEVAREHGVRVADGDALLKGTAAATTHMTDSPPDIHPRGIGYSALAAALLDAIE
jgi:lysophospholipase L1-like esterase